MHVGMHRLYLRLLYIVERSKLEVKSRRRVRIKGWSGHEDTESRGGVRVRAVCKFKLY